MALSLTSLVSAATFSNPLKPKDGSDPHIVYTGGYYYLMTTTWTNLQITRATTLGGLKNGETKVVWTDSTASRCCNIWAPELHYFDGIWYIYYTAGTSADLNGQRPNVLKGGATPFDSYSHLATLMNTTREVLALGQLQQLDLRVLRQQAEEQKNRKGRSRARLQVGGELNAARAHELRAAKAELTAQKAQAKEARIAKQAANQARRQLAGLGVEARKQERLRKKRVKAHIRAGNPIPPEDQDPILDPEAGSKPKPRSGSEAGFEPEAGSEAGSEAGFEPSFQFELEAGFEPSFELELEPGFEFKLEPGSQLARELQYELE
ncbi:hypothetical protein VE00_04230 [Pseudogymnoascus sp. WSF 3629]|nr:hypothetical protein VE00_04230 [Pseudogymnoascus sp. WSF 3629]